MGFKTEIITTEIKGEARDAARRLAASVIDKKSSMMPGDKPVCLLSGGETTVTVKGSGLGGRNQEFTLAFATEIDGNNGITLLSANRRYRRTNRCRRGYRGRLDPFSCKAIWYRCDFIS